jgi:hypothetical protein
LKFIIKISQLIITSLAIAVNSSIAVKVSTGEQINKGVNYTVVWKDREGTCGNNQLLAPVSENPCDRGFWIDNAYSESCFGLVVLCSAHTELTCDRPPWILWHR